MGRIAIEFENISKQYALGNIGTGTLSRDLNRWWAHVRGKEDPYLRIGEVNNRAKKAAGDFVWALKDVCCKVEQGEVLGIIGKNGAGKSTLLKILSRVTSPTMGCIRVRGRIASLLEVGTGFHPEMTGRENIYMNGSIMGMTKVEITRKLDEIVAFAGIEKYIDTPVKRYSSGMTVRLGFAIAAHLEPEILVVDEVLAVGDAEFQRKAVGKMQDVAKGEGRTVLFVSHNMAAVRSLCTKGMLLENGMMTFMGSVPDTINHYLEATDAVQGSKILDNVKWTKHTLKIVGIEINGTECSYSVIKSHQRKLEVKIKGYTDEKMIYDVMLVIKNKDDIPYASYSLGHNMGDIHSCEAGEFCISRMIELPPILNKGIIKVDLNLHHPMVEWLMKAPDCCTMECEGMQMGFGKPLNMHDSGLIGLDNYTECHHSEMHLRKVEE